MVTVGDDPLLGVVVEGRYKIDSVIGQGSAGTVYKAVQELIGREVAIKVLHDYLVSDQEFIKRFTQEAKASSRLSHPNIITIYDFGVIPQGGRPYIAMDLLKGTPLSDLLAEVNHLRVEEAVPIFKQVCGALAEAHRQGVVHRDVKPENIVLVERSGQRLFPIVVDFGIARLVQEESDVARITRTGTVCGSPTYMSPEQCTSSKVDHRSDIYSLGVVIYETLTGEVPFLSDELVKVMAMHLSDPPKPLNQVRADLKFPLALEEVVYKALAKNPDQRYQSMEELADALDRSLKEPEAPVLSVRPAAPSQRPPDLQPGPLAQAEDLSGARKLSTEIAAPQTKHSELAAKALDHLRSSGAYEETDGRSPAEKQALAAAAAAAAASAASSTAATAIPPDASQAGAMPIPTANASTSAASPVRSSASQYDAASSSVTASSIMARSNFAHGRGKVKPSLWSQIQPFVMIGLCVVLLGAAGYFVYSNPELVNKVKATVGSMLPKQDSAEDIPTLMKNQKWTTVYFMLQEIKQDKGGKLTKQQNEDFGKACLNIARQFAAKKSYTDAIEYGKQVPQGTASFNDAKSQLKRWKQLADQTGR